MPQELNDPKLLALDMLKWSSRWPHFTRTEMSCRHCGEIYWWPEFMDKLEQLRHDIDRPLHVLSGHRCALHNAHIGGAPLSQHLKLAVDVSIQGHELGRLLMFAHKAGFQGLGYYQTFLHLDLGRKRHWFGGHKARTLWQKYLT